MGNNSVIYLFLFLPHAALQSPSLPRVSRLSGGPLEFGTRQTSYFLAEPVRAFEDEEGMERRGGGMRGGFGPGRDAEQSSLHHPAFCRWCRHFQAGRKPAPSPKELDLGETKQERKGWKKRPSHGPVVSPLPCASSWEESDSSRGLCTAVCRQRHSGILLLEEFSLFC